MSLAQGVRIGPYELVAPLGAGGMGEVYRARDHRLGRDVALKTLPAMFAEDRERLERFEREARAAGALQHPGIVVVFDVGMHEGRPYIVSELVEGETLRAALRGGPLPPRRALAVARELASALGAAHARGIVHRDLKPENVAFTREGRVKLLDFGLAKLLLPDAASAEDTSARTIEGTLLGTAAYMAPEQARAEPADHRADLFALGCVIHEMLTGTSPFHRASPAETLAALLKDDPPPLPAAVRSALPGIEVVLRSMLAKAPAARFASAPDLAVALEAVLAAADAAGPTPGGPAAGVEPGEATFRRLTYRRGMVTSARFTPDGSGVVYAARWEARPYELFWVFSGSAESRSLGFTGCDLLSISRNSEMAISRDRADVGPFYSSGMLSRLPLGSSAPRDLLAEVQWADWGPDGTQLAVVREVEGSHRLEYPIGHVLHRSDGGWISNPRVSRDGRLVSFEDHPVRGDDAGSIAVVDLEGRMRRLSGGWGSLRGSAWSADGREVWFTAVPSGNARGLRAVNLEGGIRTIFSVPGALFLQDISAQGRVLLLHGEERLGIRGIAPGTSEERDLSWLDWSLIRGLSTDGSQILFDETGEGGGPLHSVYVRGTDGSPAIRLGDGVGLGLSPDQRTALGILGGDSARLTLMPLGAGSVELVDAEGIEIHFGGWFPDGEHVWLAGNRPGEASRIFRLGLRDRLLEPLTEPGVHWLGTTISPDGSSFTARTVEGKWCVFPVGGGPPAPIPGMRSVERPAIWSSDGRSVYAYVRGEVPTRVHRIDVTTGEREPWREILPPDPTGLLVISPVHLTPDGSTYAYTYFRHLNDLFVVEGLR